MKVKDIRNGDILTYRSGKTHYVNKDFNFHRYYREDFTHFELGSYFDIMEVKRYVKRFNHYKLKTIYKRLTPIESLRVIFGVDKLFKK